MPGQKEGEKESETEQKKAPSAPPSAPVQVDLTAAREENPRADTKPNIVAEEEIVDPAEFEASADAGPSSVDRLLDAFPGAVASDDEGNGRG